MSNQRNMANCAGHFEMCLSLALLYFFQTHYGLLPYLFFFFWSHLKLYVDRSQNLIKLLNFYLNKTWLFSIQRFLDISCSPFCSHWVGWEETKLLQFLFLLTTFDWHFHITNVKQEILVILSYVWILSQV